MPMAHFVSNRCHIRAWFEGITEASAAAFQDHLLAYGASGICALWDTFHLRITIAHVGQVQTCNV